MLSKTTNGEAQRLPIKRSHVLSIIAGNLTARLESCGIFCNDMEEIVQTYCLRPRPLYTRALEDGDGIDRCERFGPRNLTAMIRAIKVGE